MGKNNGTIVAVFSDSGLAPLVNRARSILLLASGFVLSGPASGFGSGPAEASDALSNSLLTKSGVQPQEPRKLAQAQLGSKLMFVFAFMISS